MKASPDCLVVGELTDADRLTIQRIEGQVSEVASRLLSDGLSYDDLLTKAARAIWFANASQKRIDELEEIVESLIASCKNDLLPAEQIAGLREYVTQKRQIEKLEAIVAGISVVAAKGGRAKDLKTGNAGKREAIRGAWASGKYSSRDICAEQECAALGMSFCSARKALRNTPEPGR
jgi:hypothetical protein